jgi:hypothetical protein
LDVAATFDLQLLAILPHMPTVFYASVKAAQDAKLRGRGEEGRHNRRTHLLFPITIYARIAQRDRLQQQKPALLLDSACIFALG